LWEHLYIKSNCAPKHPNLLRNWLQLSPFQRVMLNSTITGLQTQPQHQSQATTGSDINTQIEVYKFKVPWTTLPKELLDKLEEAKRANRRASPHCIDELKKAIVPKLIADYEVFKETHPQSTKHPGRNAYRDIIEQVLIQHHTVLKGRFIVNLTLFLRGQLNNGTSNVGFDIFLHP